MRRPTRHYLLLTLAATLIAGCNDTPDEVAMPVKPNPPQFFYETFMAAEGIPVLNGFSVPDLDNLVLADWPRRNARGAYLDLHGQQGLTGAYLLEIAPGKSTEPERHIYEEVLYVVSGQGTSQLWQDGQAQGKTELAHEAGALFSPPLNSWHTHTNTGTSPLRIIAFSNAPMVMDLYRNTEFVLNNPWRFSGRWRGEQEYFAVGPLKSDKASRGFGNIDDPYRMNFVPDVFALDGFMHQWKEKQADFAIFLMAGNALSPHISTWAAQDYQTAHHHNGGAIVMLLRGEGYYLMWPSQAGAHPFEDGFEDQVIRGELRAGGMYSPPKGWYHQHFNTSAEPGLYLAVTPQGRTQRLESVRTDHNPVVFAIEQEASAYPELIEIEAEDKNIRSMFEAALRERR